MANIFEEIMKQSQPVTESFVRNSNKKVVKTESKRIAANKVKLESRRIFEEVDDLDELDDQFEVTPDDVDDEENENEVVLVIDPEADPDEEIPEDAANEMIGDEVYKCPVCGANYLCSHDAIENESIEVDEEGVPVECPVCGDDTDQILIGEIAPVDGAGEETDLDMVDSEDAEDDIDVDEFDVDEEIPDDEEFVEEEDDEVLEDSLKRRRSRKRRNESKSLHRGRRGKGKKSEGKACPDCGKEPCECDEPLTEDVDDDIDVVDEVDDSLEFVDPVVEDKTSAVNIQKADTVELHFDEARLESMMTDMLRENYKGKGTFRVRNITSKDNKLKFEYVVRTNKVSKRGILVAEGFIKSNRKITLRCRDKGAFTESFTRTPSFVIECVRIRNKIIPVSVKYDFKKRVNESLYRIKGEAGKVCKFYESNSKKVRRSRVAEGMTISRSDAQDEDNWNGPNEYNTGNISYSNWEDYWKTELSSVLGKVIQSSDEFDSRSFQSFKKLVTKYYKNPRLLVDPDDEYINERVYNVIKNCESPEDIKIW